MGDDGGGVGVYGGLLRFFGVDRDGEEGRCDEVDVRRILRCAEDALLEMLARNFDDRGV